MDPKGSLLRSGERKSRFDGLVFPVVIVAAWVAYFFEVLFAGMIFCQRDLFCFHEPLRRYWVELVSEGHAPFLNVAVNLGTPIISNPNNAVFYPGNVLYLVLPFDHAWNLSLSGHVLFAALGLYWLARQFQCSRLAALSGALIFGFCGPLVSSLNYYNLLVAASWLPWVAGCAHLAWKRGGFWIAATALALASQVLSGEPTILILTAALLCGGYLVGLLGDRSRYRDVLWRGGLAGGTAVLLSAVQLLPTLMWLPHSGRATALPFRQSAAYWSLHPARLLEFLVPHVYGNPMGRLASEFWGGALSDAGVPYITKLYVGWIPFLVLAWAVRRPLGRWAAIVFACSVVLALGHYLPGYHVLYEAFPPLRIVRYPEKFTIVAAFALALSTALALSRPLVENVRTQDHDERRGSLPVVISAAVLLAVLAALSITVPHSALSAAQRSAQIRAIGGAAAVGIVSALVLILAASPRYRRIARILIPFVLFIDLAGLSWDIPRTRPREDSNARPELLSRLGSASSTPIVHLGEQQADAYFRARRDPSQSMHDALQPLTGLRWGILYGATDDIDRMGWRRAATRQANLRASLMSGFENDRASAGRAAGAVALMRVLGIGRVLSLAPMSLEGLHEESSLALPGDPPVFVYATDAEPARLARLDEDAGSLSFDEESPDLITIFCESAAGGTVIVTRNALPGWTVELDGKSVDHDASAEGLIRVAAPPGSHRMTLRYRPPGLNLGALFTLMGLTVMLGILLFSRPASGAR